MGTDGIRGLYICQIFSYLMNSNKIISDWIIGNNFCTLIIKKDLAKIYGLDNSNIKLELTEEGILIKKGKVES